MNLLGTKPSNSILIREIIRAGEEKHTAKNQATTQSTQQTPS